MSEHTRHSLLHPAPIGPEDRSLRRAYAVSIALNLSFVILEAAVGLAGNSLGLVSDAGHKLLDVLMLVIALLGAWLARRQTAGDGNAAARVSALIALVNAVILLVAMLTVIRGSLLRLSDPAPVDGTAISWTAGAGILVSGLSAWFLMRCRGDINTRAAFLHMATDSLLSVGVVLSGIIINLSGRYWIDPLVSLLIAAVILCNTVRLIAEAITGLSAR